MMTLKSKKEGIIKEFLNYKKAKDLMERISEVKDTFWKVQIMEEKEYGKIKKKLIIKIDKTWWDAEKFSKVIDLIFKEAVKYNLWVHSSYDGFNGDIKLEVEVK